VESRFGTGQVACTGEMVYGDLVYRLSKTNSRQDRRPYVVLVLRPYLLRLQGLSHLNTVCSGVGEARRHDAFTVSLLLE
jgi:hypothetical protein